MGVNVRLSKLYFGTEVRPAQSLRRDGAGNSVIAKPAKLALGACRLRSRSECCRRHWNTRIHRRSEEPGMEAQQLRCRPCLCPQEKTSTGTVPFEPLRHLCLITRLRAGEARPVNKQRSRRARASRRRTATGQSPLCDKEARQSPHRRSEHPGSSDDSRRSAPRAGGRPVNPVTNAETMTGRAMRTPATQSARRSSVSGPCRRHQPETKIASTSRANPSATARQAARRLTESAAPETGCAQKTRAIFRSSKVRKSMVPNSRSHAGGAQMRAPIARYVFSNLGTLVGAVHRSPLRRTMAVRLRPPARWGRHKPRSAQSQTQAKPGSSQAGDTSASPRRDPSKFSDEQPIR